MVLANVPVLGGLDGTGLESFDSAVTDNTYEDRFDGTVLDIILKSIYVHAINAPNLENWMMFDTGKSLEIVMIFMKKKYQKFLLLNLKQRQTELRTKNI